MTIFVFKMVIIKTFLTINPTIHYDKFFEQVNESVLSTTLL